MTGRPALILVAATKRCLATPATDRESQALTFRILTALDKLARHENGTLTDEAIAAIEPACDRFAELYTEIMKLVPKRAAPFDPAQRCKDFEPAFKVFEKPETFEVFANLNASLREAEKLCSPRYGRRAAEAAS
jgi:benzoyl-CoA reductase/2-hydroxyglutaryl-CoA dehydratase subunit BcrC/BadD/HgdB